MTANLNNFRSLILFTAGSALVMASLLCSGFPVFIFFAFTPFLALLDIPWNSKIYFLLPACLVGILSELILYRFHLNSPVLLYVFLTAGLFAGYRTAQHLTQNRLNKFTLVILFVAMEYLLLTLMTTTNPVFLSDFLHHKPDWTRWNIYTGYLGSGFWILCVNLMLYQAIFKSGKVNLLFALTGVAMVIAPILYSHQLENVAVTKADMISMYAGTSTPADGGYSIHGELISRTGAWVSVLIIIFTLVRIKTKKVAR